MLSLSVHAWVCNVPYVRNLNFKIFSALTKLCWLLLRCTTSPQRNSRYVCSYITGIYLVYELLGSSTMYKSHTRITGDVNVSGWDKCGIFNLWSLPVLCWIRSYQCFGSGTCVSALKAPPRIRILNSHLGGMHLKFCRQLNFIIEIVLYFLFNSFEIM